MELIELVFGLILPSSEFLCNYLQLYHYKAILQELSYQLHIQVSFVAIWMVVTNVYNLSN